MIKIVNVASLTPQPNEPGEYSSNDLQGVVVLKESHIASIRSGAESFVLMKSKESDAQKVIWLAVNPEVRAEA